MNAILFTGFYKAVPIIDFKNQKKSLAMCPNFHQENMDNVGTVYIVCSFAHPKVLRS